MDDKKKLDNLKDEVKKEETPFQVEQGLNEKDLEGVSGGTTCQCRCGVDVYPYNPTCGGGGGGGTELE